MPRKNDAVTATVATAEEPIVDAPQVVVSEQSPVDESAPQPSAQTIAEMAAGREALLKHANNP